jgi:hypothetical protein
MGPAGLSAQSFGRRGHRVGSLKVGRHGVRTAGCHHLLVLAADSAPLFRGAILVQVTYLARGDDRCWPWRRFATRVAKTASMLCSGTDHLRDRARQATSGEHVADRPSRGSRPDRATECRSLLAPPPAKPTASPISGGRRQAQGAGYRILCNPCIITNRSEPFVSDGL